MPDSKRFQLTIEQLCRVGNVPLLAAPPLLLHRCERLFRLHRSADSEERASKTAENLMDKIDDIVDVYGTREQS